MLDRALVVSVVFSPELVNMNTQFAFHNATLQATMSGVQVPGRGPVPDGASLASAWVHTSDDTSGHPLGPRPELVRDPHLVRVGVRGLG